MKSLNHPNIVHLIENIDCLKQIFLILDLIKGQSLYSYLKTKEGRRLPENECKGIFKQLIEGIGYCHSLNICHRDIKLENIIIDEYKKIVIIDFGFATKMQNNQFLKIFCGTPSYMAPEIVKKQKYNGINADMWSLGILLYILLIGSYPFIGENERDLYKNIIKGEFNYKTIKISEEAKFLINSLLQIDPKSRPSCDQVFINSYLIFHFLKILLKLQQIVVN